MSRDMSCDVLVMVGCVAIRAFGCIVLVLRNYSVWTVVSKLYNVRYYVI